VFVFCTHPSGDIEKDEELTHTYISLEWRTCFSDLNEIVNSKGKEEEEAASSS
jgi:hypothetical protein